MSEKIKVSAPLLMVFGMLVIIGAVGIIGSSPVKLSVKKPLSEAASAIRVISPNGGKTFKIGDVMDVVFSGCQFAGISLVNSNKTVLNNFPYYYPSDIITTSSGQKSIRLKIPLSVAPGSYYVLGECFDSGNNSFDYSDGLNTFILSSLQSGFIKNVYPDGSYTVLDTTKASWVASGVYRYSVSLFRKNSSGVYQFVTQIPNVFSASAQLPFHLSTTGLWPANTHFANYVDSTGTAFSGDNQNFLKNYISKEDYGKQIFKIKVIGFDVNGKIVATGESKNPFQVVSELAPPTTKGN